MTETFNFLIIIIIFFSILFFLFILNKRVEQKFGSSNSNVFLKVGVPREN